MESFVIKIFSQYKINSIIIIIKSVDFKASNALKTFVREKVKKLFKQFDKIIRANVILKKEEGKNHENELCEIRLVVPGYGHFVKKAAENIIPVSHSVDV